MKLTFSTGAGTDDATGRHARARRRVRSEPWPAEPLWPPPDPARDRVLLLDLASGEDGAEARLYDAYAARLHDYAASVLREGPASDVVHDVLVDAARRAARVRDRERLGAWLYGATRARLRRRTFPRPHWDWSAAPGDPRPAVPVRVRDAVDHLMAVTGPTERELLLLTGRHGLTTDDLEGVLGRPGRALRRRCALAWRRAAEIVAAHEAVSGASAVSPSPFKAQPFKAQPFKVQGSTPPNGLPYFTGDSARPEGYPSYGTPPERLPFFARGPSRSSLSYEPGELLFAPHEFGVDRLGGDGVEPELRVEELLVAPIVPPPPQRLRMRVLHTLADPELAPYRAEIRARGGRLTPDGLPRQPDATSPVARRTRRATLRTTLTGAAAVTGVRTSAAATATVGTALVPLFLVPASTPTNGLGPLAPGGHGGHSIAVPVTGDLHEPLPDRPSDVADADAGTGTPLPSAELPTVSLAPPDDVGDLPIIERPKYPDAPAISGGVPGGSVLPGLPVGPPALTVPAGPRHLLESLPQVIGTVPQIVQALPDLVQAVPDVVQALPRVVQAVPEVVQDVPAVVRDVPRTLQAVPKAVQDVPRVVEDVPRVVRNVPRVVQDVPKLVEDVPHHVQDVPDVVRDVPGEISGPTGTPPSFGHAAGDAAPAAGRS